MFVLICIQTVLTLIVLWRNFLKKLNISQQSGCSCNRGMLCFYVYSMCKTIIEVFIINRGSYISAHVLLNLLKELRKRVKVRGLPSILSLFCNKFNKFNNTRALMLDYIYHMTLRLLWNLISAVKNVITLSLYTQHCYGCHKVSRKSINH